jgi:hypothetical protein
LSATYDIGDIVVMQAIFTDGGELVEPTTVKCYVKPPGQSRVEVDVIGPDDETSAYTAEAEPDVKGTWYYRFEGTGGYEAAEEGVFSVRKQQVAP